MTPSQTIGPFFGFALPWPAGPQVVPESTPGAVHVRGQLLDGKGEPVTDGLVETWQADAEGRFAGSGAASWFRGFGRCPTDRDGQYVLVTVKPGALRGPGGVLHAPHILVSVLARGLLKRVVTRIYFPDEPAANEMDPTLAAIPDRAQRATLIAASASDGYHFDVRLQGEGETIFFDV